MEPCVASASAGSGYLSESDEAPLIPTSTSDGTTVRVRMPEGASGEEEGVEEDPSSVDVHARFPKERCKTALTCLMLVFAALANDIVLSVIHEKVPETPPLPDFVFSLTPYWPYGLVVTEYVMLSCFGATLLLILFHRHRWIVLRRLSFIGGLLYAGRCVTMLATQVPKADPNYYCSPKLEGANATVWNILLRALSVASGLGLKLNGKHTLCGDYIYSGHTIVLVLSALFISQYSPRNWKLLHYLVWLLALAGMLLLMVSRGHYTIDVIISYFLCTRLFWIYHTLASMPSFKVSRQNHLRKVFWFPLFEFLEGNIHRPLPRRCSSTPYVV